MREIERALVDTEDFLMRQLGSSAARQASTRKLKRGAAEAFRRLRRAGLIFVLLILGLIVATAFGAGIGFFTWLVALPVIFLAAALSMTFPTRAGRAPPAPTPEAVAQIPLPVLAEKCESWLLDRCDELPRAALPAADLILGRLRHLQPALADVPASSPLHGEVQRLVGGHLPRLVDSYLALPLDARDARSENNSRLAESLDSVAEEMSRLCGEIDGCRATSFEIEHRFIESRYREDPSLRRP
ncbi:MAG TPA: hypothetical protein VF577_03445 [Allosphingosinicella sp.]|jgi:hypothetical protein